MLGVNKKETAKSWLTDVPQDKVFWRHGRAVKNPEKLVSAFQKTTVETFGYQITSQVNFLCELRANTSARYIL